MQPQQRVREAISDFYHYSLCHFCKEPHPNLKRCIRCKIVYYCSREHQVQDWLTHKDVCTLLAAVKEKHIFTPCLDADSFTIFKMQGALMLSVILGYPVSGALADMFLHPKVCAVCYSENLIAVCQGCLSAGYCSEVHRTIMNRNHLKHCRALRECLDVLVELHQKTQSLLDTHLIPIFPDDVESLPKNYNEMVKILKLLPENLFKLDSLVLGSLIAYGINIINALESSKFVDKRRARRNKLLVHIAITDQPVNTDWYFLIEFLAHWIVNLQKVKIVLIGHNVPTLEILPEIKCDRCKTQNVRREFSSIHKDYCEMFQILPKPDVVAFFHQPIESMLLPYIKSGVPVVITADSGMNLMETTQLFPSSQVTYILRPTTNKYATAYPIRNVVAGDDPVLYRHKFITIFIKK